MSFRENFEIRNSAPNTTPLTLSSAYSPENAATLRDLNAAKLPADLPDLLLNMEAELPPRNRHEQRGTVGLIQSELVPETIVDDSDKRPIYERQDPDKQVASTLSKYFDQIDQSHWYSFGKDHELSKSEILQFLASDAGKNLSNKEVRDLLSAANQFDRISSLHQFGVFGLDHGSGITQADVQYLAEGTSSFDIEYGQRLKELQAYLETHPMPRASDLLR
jgi:hypothetical protein